MGSHFGMLQSLNRLSKKCFVSVMEDFAPYPIFSQICSTKPFECKNQTDTVRSSSDLHVEITYNFLGAKLGPFTCIEQHMHCCCRVFYVTATAVQKNLAGSQ